MTRIPEQPGVPRSMLQPKQSARQSGEVASPHRAGHSSGLHPEDQPYQSEEIRNPRCATHRPEPVPVDDEEEQEEEEGYEIDNGYDDPPRMPSSVRRYGPAQPTYPHTVMRIQYYNSAVPPRASRTQTQDYRLPAPAPQPEPERRTTAPQPRRRSLPRLHPLVYVGLGMLIVVLLWQAGTALVQWWQGTQDTWHYGYPRTYQTDAVVGHQDSREHPSHFLVLNLRGHIIIYELPGGDGTRTRIYIGPVLYASGSDLTPVTIQFQDPTGTGKPDLILVVGTERFIYHNTGTSFVPPKPNQ